MSFGLGFAMPHFSKVLASGAAPVVPMTIVGYTAQALTIGAGDNVGFGVTLTISPALASGDKIFFAYSDEVDLGMGNSGFPTGVSNFTQIAAPTSANGNWFVYSSNVTATVAAGSSYPIGPSGPAVNYGFYAMWVIRGANATVPYEASSAAIVATTGTNTQSFSVTTGNANDCVLSLAYPVPIPNFADGTNVLNSFTPTTSGWGSSLVAQDGVASKCFWILANPNIATASTTSVSATVSAQTGTGTNVLTFNIKK